jgi:hypothetical protein
MSDPADLLARLDACPLGVDGWRQFEDLGVDILKYLFVPPLAEPHIQARSFSGIDRRDAIFPNRNMTPDIFWGQLNIELNARMVLVEFKNYDAEELGKDEVDQARNYLTKLLGRLAIICCRKDPRKEAFLRRNQVYTQERKVILFVTEEKLKEMIHMKERGDDPSRLIMEMVELFYIQHE